MKSVLNVEMDFVHFELGCWYFRDGLWYL